ncbi:ComEC/Rec2 family competence protein [Microbacterium album]|uniref:Competence protein ComEC n=1 Tax=Microbacterium album TaxID=2053191 RepID=A0A917MME9_9MICO|nr:ComEC/Rec2 family competence protein [Microbacterium album]GGH48106.1 competence protein ComEC [Microbacterium album]
MTERSALEGEEGGAHLRMLPVAVVAWLAAFAGTWHPSSAGWLSIGAWTLAGAGLLLWRRLPAARRVACGIAVLTCAAAGAVGAHVAMAQPTRDVAVEFAGGGGRALEIELTVVSKVDLRGDAVWFDGRTSAIARGEERLAIGVPVRVRVPAADVTGARLDLGSSAAVRGTAMAADPGDRAALVVFARAAEVTASPAHVLGAVSSLRDAFVERASSLPGPGSQLLAGLSVGDTRAVSDELDTAMKVTSLSHLTAVSGANCAIVVGIAFGATALAGAGRAVRIVVSLVALAGFVLLVTPEGSVVRAATMAAIALLALVLGRVAAGVAVLSLAVAVLLIADPWLAGSYGFVLSVAATGALLLLARPLARGASRWMPAPLALAISVPLSAQLACGPVLILLAPEVPTYGVVANLLAGPAAPAATVIGLAACLAAPLPVLADGLAALAWLPSAWIAATALTTAALPGASLAWPPGLGGAVLLAAVGGAAALLIARSDRAGVADRVTRRAIAAVLAVIVGVAGGGAALTNGPVGRLAMPADWAIAACDVGQGDALVVRSAGAVGVIDTGPDPDALGSCLTRLGISRVDLLVLTHFDLDHVGGVAAVEGRVDAVLHGPTGRPADERVLERLEGARLLSASAGTTGTLGDARWRVLWPRAEGVAFASGNDASVILEIAGGGLPRSILLGDLSAAAQLSLLGTGRVAGPYAVVKVAHHGSADQHEPLYAEIAASLALVTVGADNDYGHPRREILDTLARLGATTARTDLSGLLLVADGPDGLRLWRERPP